MLEQFGQFEIQNPSFIYGGMKKIDFIKNINNDGSPDLNDVDSSDDDSGI